MRYETQILAAGLVALGTFILPAVADEASRVVEQTTCPVMLGNKVDPSIYVDYEGKRVFFCCDVCKDTFEQDPNKYLDELPQFGEPVTDMGSEEHHHGDELSSRAAGPRLHRFTAPLGIATFSLLVLTLCIGLLRRKLKRRFLAVHRTLAFATIVVAALHALTVLLGH